VTLFPVKLNLLEYAKLLRPNLFFDNLFLHFTIRSGTINFHD